MKNYFNQNYFEKIDTDRKAYFLGLLYADGSINNKGRIVINLQEGDYEVLEKLKNDIEYTGNLYTYNKKFPRKNQKVLCLYSKKTVDDLLKLGMSYKKTQYLEFPQFLDNDLMIHFIRGFYDGDGWISRFNNHVSVGIICLDSIAMGIHNYLKSINIHSIIYPYKTKKYTISNIVHIEITKKRQMFNLLTLFYNNTDLYINRKYQKYIECFIKEELHLLNEHLSINGSKFKGRDREHVYKLDEYNNIIHEFKSLKESSRMEKIDIGTLTYHLNKYKNNEIYKNDLNTLYCRKKDYDINHVFLLDPSKFSKTKKKVCQMNMNNNIIKIWDYISETENYGFDPSTIVKCCKGKSNSHKGFKWKYNN